jgi:uncharacterized alkaline shock family protein YloU
MIFLKKLGVYVYMILMLGVGLVFLAVSANVVSAEQWTQALNALYGSLYLQVAVGAVGGLFVLLGITSPFRAAKGFQKTRIIAFQNPDGEVTISLSAIEDYIKKIADTMPDIRDIRSRVSPSRKGINIICDVSISPGANIPQVTEKIQMMAKNKLHGMLGVEEGINIQMHINRIAKGAMPEMTEAPEEEAHPHVPFREME